MNRPILHSPKQKGVFLTAIFCCLLVAHLNAQISNVSFVNVATVNTGSGSSALPEFIAIEDLDGDGKKDIIVPNSTDNSISVFQNTSTPGNITAANFTKTDYSAASSNALTIRVADMDGDGKKDVLLFHGSGTSTPTNISVFLNTTTTPGTITLAARTLVPCIALGADLKDIDGDGKLDVVALDYFGAKVRIYQNQSVPGTVTFAPSPATYTTNAGAASVKAEDFTGDGKPDLVITCYSANTVVNTFQNTSGISGISFSAGPSLTTGTGVNGLQIGDLNNDGKVDVVTANYTGNSISIFQNNSTSSLSFGAGVTISGLSNPQDIALFDFDQDGFRDIAVANRGNASVSVYRNFMNTGDNITASSFASSPGVFSVSTNPALASGDIDGDGKEDIVTTSRAASTVTVSRNVIQPSNGLMAYYPFTGNAGDSSGFNNHGTASGGAALTMGRNGMANSAYYFNGSSGAKITAPASASLNTANMKEITMAQWFKPKDSLSINGKLLSLQSASNTNYDLAYDYALRKIRFVNFNGTTLSPVISMIFSGEVDTSKWNHVAITMDSLNNIKCYLNGVLDTAFVAVPLKPVNPVLTIGNHRVNPWSFSGSIDEVKIYNKALSSKEVLQMVETDVTSGLFAHYLLNGNAGDSSGNGLHGTNPTNVSNTTDRFNEANKAYYFTGTNSKVEIPGNSMQFNSYTYSVWVRVDTMPANNNIYSILSIGNSGTIGDQLIAVGNNYSTQALTGISAVSYGTPVINPNNTLQTGVLPVAHKWYHVVCVRDSAANKFLLYVNGVKVADQILVRPAAGYSAPVKGFIGARSPGLQFFKGALDDIRIYNRAMKAADIVSLYEMERSDGSGLFAYYPLNGNTGDSSGNGLHGTNPTNVSNTTNRFNEANKAYYFTGTNSKVEIPGNSMRFNSYTYSVWVRVDTMPANNNIYSILSIGNSGTTGDQFIAVGNNYSTQALTGLSAVSYGTPSINPNNTLQAGVLPVAGKWYHIVSVRDSVANKFLLYIDGVKVADQILVRPAAGYSAPVKGFIGARSPGLQFFKGALDDIRIYNKALDAAGVFALYEREKAPEPPRYYSKSTGNLNNVSTWGTNPDGSGTSPMNFDSSDVTYIVTNNVAPSMGGNWIINGANSVVVLGDGSTAFNLLVPTANTITCDSVYVRNNITFSIQGSVNINKLGAETGSTVQFISTAAQQIIKGSYHNLSVSGGIKTLTGATTVRNTLNMLASIDGASNTFTIGTSTSQTGTLNRTSGTVIGKLTRWQPASATTLVFPIGTAASSYKEIQLAFTGAPAAGGTLTAEFVQTAPGNTGLPLFDFPIFIDKTSPIGYWKLTSANGLSGGTYTVSATASGITGVKDSSQLRLLKRSPGGAWTLEGTHAATTGSNVSPVVSRSGVSGFTTEFGIGADQSVNPLPVKLVQFTAKALNRYEVKLDWKTASELNNNHFDVERSDEGKEFVKVGEVKGAGNTNRTTFYSFNDKLAVAKMVVFYRLKQVDNNGDFTYSDIVSVRFDASGTMVLYPNPSNGILYVNGLQQEAVVSDLLGNEVMKIRADGLIDVSELKQGVYVIRSGNITQKLIRN